MGTLRRRAGPGSSAITSTCLVLALGTQQYGVFCSWQDLWTFRLSEQLEHFWELIWSREVTGKFPCYSRGQNLPCDFAIKHTLGLSDKAQDCRTQHVLSLDRCHGYALTHLRVKSLGRKQPAKLYAHSSNSSKQARTASQLGQVVLIGTSNTRTVLSALPLTTFSDPHQATHSTCTGTFLIGMPWR